MKFQTSTAAYNQAGIDPSSINPYRFVTEAYNGSGGFSNGKYLFPFAREFDFESRRKQSFFENYTKGVADSLYIPVFANLAQRRTDSDMFEAFIENADNNGNHLQGVMKTVGKFTTLHGVSFVVMDNFADTPEQMQTAIDNRLFPYVYVKTADQVTHDETDEWGRLIQITFRDGEYEIENEKGEEEEHDAYRYWDSEKSYRFYCDKEGNEITIGEVRYHNLGVIPVIPVQKEIDYEDFMCTPPFYDIARMNLAIFNGSSELNNLQRQQAFSLLVIPSDNTNPDMEIGSNSVLCIPTASSISPSFISPDSSIMTAVQSNVESIVKSLLDSADTLGATAVNNGNSAKSGVAMSYQFLGNNWVLTQMAQIAEKTEMKIKALFEIYTGTSFDYVVNYDTNYRPNPNDVKVKFEVLERMAAMDLSPALKSQIKVAMIDVMQSLFDINDEQIDKLRTLVAEENDLESGTSIDMTTE